MKTATEKIVLTKEGLVNKQVLSMIENCRFDEESRKIYTGYYSGRGRFTTRHSAMHTITSILDAQGYRYESGNDSKRNGADGEFVKVSKVAFDFIVQLQSGRINENQLTTKDDSIFPAKEFWDVNGIPMPVRKLIAESIGARSVNSVVIFGGNEEVEEIWDLEDVNLGSSKLLENLTDKIESMMGDDMSVGSYELYEIDGMKFIAWQDASPIAIYINKKNSKKLLKLIQ